jgi:Tn3 transposase DDE domain/Phage integrase family
LLRTELGKIGPISQVSYRGRAKPATGSGESHVATWIEGATRELAASSVKQRLAAIRHLFDWLFTGQVVPVNPAASVRGPRHVVTAGQTPVLDPTEARGLLDSIDTAKVVGLRDRALIGLMVYSFARIGAALGMSVEDVFTQNRRLWVRLREKGGKRHAMPCHHNLEEYLTPISTAPVCAATLEHHIGERVDAAAIREGWDKALRIGISIEDRVLAPSTVLKKLAALPKTNVVSRALREIGRIERTLFMIEWYSSPELRDRCRVGLNKGEAGNKLARAVFFHERGEIRDGSFESQAFLASGLNLVVSAIVLWNTAYLSRAVESLREEGHELPDDLIRHISPQIWEHINLTGIYDWGREPQPKGTFRPLCGQGKIQRRRLIRRTAVEKNT